MEKHIRKDLDDNLKAWQGNITLNTLILEYIQEQKNYWAIGTINGYEYSFCLLYTSKLIGDTVGQKAFAHAGFTVNKEVRKPGIEMLNVLLAPCRDRPHILRRADAEAGIYGL